MPPLDVDEVEMQRNYYSRTAQKYNEMHVSERDEHYFALSLLIAALDYLDINSILDVGSGTGRAILHLKGKRPEVKVVGVEPVEELRKRGYENGISKNELIDGDALKLQFRDDQFDLVCAFGVLHHIKTPDVAVSEMLRVAKKAIFISDANNFGQGRFMVRSIKQIMGFLGLWRIVDLIKTKGKGYSITEGDGVTYSYSVFNNYQQIEKVCKSIHLLNTIDGRINPYRTASHVALLGIKK